ncbi:hypothetical protein LTR20_009727 [Exophiala xenobiotica]|nr:hypothetical protein LTS13_003956 [Exophiala xenobiotica]KAK5391641.1 hypothetical protein LTR79_010941 [Exophiala xenobiotica]KAK5411672.1 hypothetical protein LTR90_008046 [Exophiala xenobiotica]KAK5455341.1 hypothetical protein LTR20_009727 [Exophiala xenobiotica]KAK5483688.1 hypothetical protein LTR26_006121 [Exophiala xenobiotica]
MAVAENGRPIESVKDRPNGHAVGPVVRRPRARRQSWTFWLFNSLARLTIWYALLTIIFRCPSTPDKLTESSPQICQSYLGVKSYAQPRLQPYYDEYAAPYVAKAQPYAELANRRLVRPASIFARLNYDKYAAPQIDTGKEYLQAQWQKSAVPQLKLAQDNAAKLYNANLAPYVDQVTAVTVPYFSTARELTDHTYQHYLLPSAKYSRPHLENAYNTTQRFVSTTAYPLGRHAWSNVVIFVDGTFWPFLKGLYIDNVRPQLVMINERVAKYRESRKLKAAMDDVDKTYSSSPASASPTGAGIVDDVYAMFEADEETTASATTSMAATQSTVEPPAKPTYARATEEQISEDLKNWQEKFAVAADKGTDDLRERVTSIANSLVKSDIDGIGRGLATALEKTVQNEIDNVKTKIKSVVGAVPEDASSEEVKKAAEEILGSIRASGAEIKGRAQKVRDWAQNFETGLIQRLTAASASTLEVLDGIKDLGLQEVGMRWAWMEGVNYKHWAKFHAVRKQLDDWKKEVQNVATESPESEKAISTARQIMEESMAITEDAAKELVRLKSVAQWKLRARDATDDFETKSMPAEAVSAASSLASELQGIPSQGVDSASSALSQASEAVADGISSASSAVVGTSTGTMESATSKISELADEALASASSAVGYSSTGSLESAASQASSSVADAYESASSVVVGTSTRTVESLASQLSESASSLADGIPESFSSATSVIASSASSLTDSVVSPTDILSSASSTAEEMASSVSSAAESANSKVSSKVFAGAMAQEVKGTQPILDDVFDDDTASSFSEKVQSVVNGAGDRYAEVTRAVSEAIYGTQQGTVESITSVASDQYASALAAASSVIYGAPQGTAESIASAASEHYNQAVAAASAAIYGTPAPLTDSMLQQASSLYSQAMSRAEENYNAAKSAASKQISGTPKPIHEEMLSSIESAYSGATAAANSRLESARSAVPSKYSALHKAAASALPTTNPLRSVTAMASSALQDSLAAASAQYSKAKVAVGATPAPAHERYLKEAQKNYYAAIGMAHEQYDDFVKAASSAMYGTPTPVLSSMSSAASAAVYGTPVPAYQSLVNAAASQYSAASAAAASSLESYRSSINSAATPAQSLLDSALGAYSDAVEAASSSLSSASYAASTAVYGTPAPFYQSALDGASSSYVAASAAAASHMSALLDSASSAAGRKKSPSQGVLDSISSQYDAAISAASSSLSSASIAASTAIYGAPTGSVESLSSVASENWQALVSKASEQVYGTPRPFYDEWVSQAGDYSAQATNLAADQYVIIQSYVSELIVGKEPDFTESVMNRLSSAYYTGYYASAASLANDAYDSASSMASSVSSVASSYFTPPPEVSSILDSVTDQLNAAVDAASAQMYGTTKGTVEQATSAAADSYASASAAVSEAIYGTPVGYAEAAQSSFGDMAKSAQDAISLAIYGTPTGTVESVTSVAADTYSSVSSVVGDGVSAAASVVGDVTGQAASMADSMRAKVSEAVYGPEQSAMESAQSRIAEAVESARSAIAAMASGAGASGASVADAVSSSVDEMASAVSSTVSSATQYVRDEL